MGLTLQFIPFRDIENLDSKSRIKLLLKHAKSEKIIILEGRIKREEEAELIKKTMEEIDENFKGIELYVIYPEKENASFFKKVHKQFVNVILGDRQGMTIIGPASIVREIKRDPNKIQLITEDLQK